MKNCPKCGAQYDNETLLFCTRDGTPLVEQGAPPEFKDMPSESWEEETIVNIPVDPASRKVVIETQPVEPVPPPPVQPNVQARRVPPYEPPPQKPKIALTIVLTALCTIAIIAIAFVAWWAINGGTGNDLPADGNLDANLLNVNVNANANMFNANYNANMMNIDMNANFNANANFNSNYNFNVNTNFNTDFNSNANFNANRPTPTPRPSPTPKPTETPDEDPEEDPTPTPSGTPGVVNLGNLNSRARNLPVPTYPPAAKTAGINGTVAVSVVVDESGNVISARAASGPLMLRGAAESAARQARFSPQRMGGQPVKMSGSLLYTFQ